MHYMKKGERAGYFRIAAIQERGISTGDTEQPCRTYTTAHSHPPPHAALISQ
jgi:hypothetical protein